MTTFIDELISAKISYETKIAKLEEKVFSLFRDEEFDDINFDWYDASITITLSKSYPKESYIELFDMGLKKIYIRKHALTQIVTKDKLEDNEKIVDTLKD